jgi:hypothetical protein
MLKGIRCGASFYASYDSQLGSDVLEPGTLEGGRKAASDGNDELLFYYVHFVVIRL